MYFEGRTMKINKCYNLLKDKDTTFLINPNEITIQACNTHVCEYELAEDLTFTPKQCYTKTRMACPDDKGDVYAQNIMDTTKIKLNANYVTFLDKTLKHANLQLIDTEDHNPNL